MSWDELIPVDETESVARFLVKTWNLIARSCPDQVQYRKHEPKLTEFLNHHLNRLKAESGLTGFWVNEAQELNIETDNKICLIRKDITYLSNACKPPLELVFEFKKLTNSSLAKYRGKNGMRRFVDGNYALKQPLAIMVGILNGDDQRVLINLRISLSKESVCNTLQMVRDSRDRYVRIPSEVIASAAEFDTEHRRPADKAPPNGTTTVAHIFVVCHH